MSTKVALQRIDEQGWRRGFSNLLSRENNEAWRNRRWLLQTILWLAIITGITSSALWDTKTSTTGSSSSGASSQVAIDPNAPDTNDPVVAGSLIFVLFGGIAGGIRIILMMQSAIIDEKKSGTAAWIMSKPVSRSAFILAKLISRGIASILSMIIFPGVATFILLTARTGSAPAVIPFIAGVGLVGLTIVFYLTLTLMLGTLFEERGPVIGIPLIMLIGSQLFLGLAPFLDQITPWQISFPPDQGLPLATLLILGQPLPSLLPIITTMGWIVLFVGVAIWRFAREEF